MAYDPYALQRRSLRIPDFDYSRPGFYFVTLCTHERTPLFGVVEHGQMHLSETGNVAQACWIEIPQHYPKVIVHDYIIMPEHIHSILEIAPDGLQIIQNSSVQNVDIELNPDSLNTSLIKNPPLGFKILNPNGGFFPNDFIPSINDLTSMNPLEPSPHQKRNTYQHIIPRSLGCVIRGYKTGVTKQVRSKTPDFIVWQKGYFDKIIRNTTMLQNIKRYILNNPENYKKET